METKAFWKSKTLWANVVMFGLDIINGVYGAVPIPADVKVYVVLGVNVLLRFLTTGAISLTAK